MSNLYHDGKEFYVLGSNNRLWLSSNTLNKKLIILFGHCAVDNTYWRKTIFDIGFRSGQIVFNNHYLSWQISSLEA